MKRLLVLTILSFSGMAFGSATDYYVSPIFGGTCLGHPASQASDFNLPSQWGTGALQIGPGTTVHLCGIFTGGVGATIFTFQGSGSAGNPITLKFESGAMISSPALGNSGAINTNGKNFVVIDGGGTGDAGAIPSTFVPQGVIQNTDNGTALGHQQASKAILIPSGTNITVQNLFISNIYQRSGTTTEAFDDTTAACIYGGTVAPPNQVTITNNQMTNAGWCLQNVGASDQWEVSHNDISGMEHSASLAPTTLLFHDNHLHDWGIWDAPCPSPCAYHHDGLHVFAGVGGQVKTLDFYNNQCDGAMDSGNPALGQFNECLFVEGGTSATRGMLPGGTALIFNNVCLLNHTAPGCFLIAGNSTTGDNGDRFFNNTMIGNAPNDTPTNGLNTAWGNTVSVENNASGGFGGLVSGGTATTYGIFDFNFYQNCTTFNCFFLPFVDTGSFPTWQAAKCSGGVSNTCDQHGGANLGSTSYFNLTSTCIPGSVAEQCIPQVGSPLISAGNNLSLLCTGPLLALCKDKNGVPRPTSGNWTAGAYQVSSSAPLVSLVPTSLSYGSVPVGSTSTPQSVTLKNVGSATLHVTALAISPGTDFNISGRSCPVPAFTLTVGSSCTISVTFNPGTTGAKSENLVFTDDAAGSPQQVPLSGTGAATAPAVTLTPPSLNFGNVPVGSSSTQTVNLLNSGASTLNISSIALAGVFNANNVDNNSSGWKFCWAGGTGGTLCTPGGSGTVTSGPTQTFGNSSPSLDGSSEKIAFTGTAFTDVLFFYEAGAHNTATRFKADYEVYITPGNYQDLEFDTYQYLHSSLDEFMFGSQCQTGGFWQVWNALLGTWNNTTLVCSLSAGSFHHITWNVHRVAGDTSCASSHPCMHYDTLTIDGVVNQINITWPAGVLPGTFADQTGLNFQMDTNSSGGAVAENLDYVGMAGATDYSITTTCGATLAAGASCGISVTFTPSGTGIKSDEVDIASSAPSSVDIVPVSGNGQTTPGLVSCTASGGAIISGGASCQ